MHTSPPDRLEELLQQKETLREMIESISSELALRPLLTRIVQQACELLGAYDGSIGLYDQLRSVIRTEAIYRMPDDELGAEMRPGIGLAGQVLLSGKPVLLRRYGDVENPVRPELLENSVIGVPIFWREEILGFFGIGARPPRRFTERDVDMLSLFARHAAIAIMNARRYEREQRRNERLSLIARVGQIITEGLQLEELLRGAAEAIHELLGYENVAIPLIDPQEPHILLLRIVGGSYRELITKEYRLPIDDGIMGAAARERQTQLVNNVLRDPRYIQTPGSQGIFAELAVPILLENQILGVLNVESSEPFDEEDATSLQIIAGHLAVAIKNARLYQQAQLVAALEERHRLSRDLHDSVTQTLASLTLLAQTLSRAWQKSAEEGQRRTGRLLELSRSALAEMRSLVSELRVSEEEPLPGAPDPYISDLGHLSRSGLETALRQMTGRHRLDGLSIELSFDGYEPISTARERALYHIAREAISNALKHAEAARLQVRLGCDERSVHLSVIDDGRGFDPDGVLPPPAGGYGLSGGYGLKTMQERAEAANGGLRIDSAPGRGTAVHIRLPRNER